MKVLLLGSGGQLGWELQRTCPDHVTVTTCDFPKIDFCSDLSITRCIQETLPDRIINAAAYTAVDRAEQEPDLAFRINHRAVEQIAEHCSRKKTPLIHISTDFIFSGQNFRPYLPDDVPDPQSVYGKSKLKGEQAIQEILKDQALIIRTAWLYSAHGTNFVKTMLKLMKEKQRLTIIDEQIGTPTWAFGLAKAIWSALEKNLTGIFHYTDAGVASWYDFAVAIQEEGSQAGLLGKAIPILPISTNQYPTPAKRPMYSVLDKTSFWQAISSTPVHWRVQLRSMLKEITP
jgi:dTDP-4-dehydrorhamnose reductase